MKSSVVEMLNNADGFWLAGLAREVWPVACDHLAALKPEARMAVEHYMLHLATCRTYNEPDGCKGCRRDTSDSRGWAADIALNARGHGREGRG